MRELDRIENRLNELGVTLERTPSARAKQVEKLIVFEDDWDEFP